MICEQPDSSCNVYSGYDSYRIPEAIMLVPLYWVRQDFNVDHNFDDAKLIRRIREASATVLTYVGREASNYYDSTAENFREIPWEWKAATRILAGMMFREPDGDTEKNFQDGRLPGAVRALLAKWQPVVLA